MTNLIKARGLTKHFGQCCAIDHIDLDVGKGQIIGLIGPNGAGKTTLLKSLLGLTDYQGDLEVLGMNPAIQREQLMEKACFISDVAILPKWATANQLIEYMASAHPKFDRQRALELLSGGEVGLDTEVGALSKGMVAQLHLSLVMAVDVNLLILDEPTLGLDIVFKESFYQTLLQDYFNGDKTIIITTHNLKDIQNVLTRLVFIKGGKIVLDAEKDDIDKHYSTWSVPSDMAEEARKLSPIYEKKLLGESLFIYEDEVNQGIAEIGEQRITDITDLFLAKMEVGV